VVVNLIRAVIPFPYFSLLHTYSTRVLHPCGKTTGNGLVQAGFLIRGAVEKLYHLIC
jgi:hypothetical protein